MFDISSTHVSTSAVFRSFVREWNPNTWGIGSISDTLSGKFNEAKPSTATPDQPKDTCGCPF
jgi:hypothetical protein